MARGMPSMAALLGMIALAGYQNRDKLIEIFQGSKGNNNDRPDRIATEPDASIGDGIRQVIDAFTNTGNGQTAESWVQPGNNEELQPSDLEQAIGSETIADLSEKTGLTKQQILDRLSRDLPRAVDGLTPDGKVPT